MTGRMGRVAAVRREAISVSGTAEGGEEARRTELPDCSANKHVERKSQTAGFERESGQPDTAGLNIMLR